MLVFLTILGYPIKVVPRLILDQSYWPINKTIINPVNTAAWILAVIFFFPTLGQILY
jgi:hypothetical protein